MENKKQFYYELLDLIDEMREGEKRSYAFITGVMVSAATYSLTGNLKGQEEFLETIRKACEAIQIEK